MSVESPPRAGTVPESRLDRVREAFAGFLSTVAAATVPAGLVAACLYAGADGRSGVVLVAFCMAFAVALAHAMILGLPTALVLVHARRFRAIPMLIAGGAVGSVPSALLFFPYAAPRAWIDYLAVVGVAFGLGAAGGLAFHLAHRVISPDRARHPARKPAPER